MAYDETLALRIREALDVRAGVVERKMFGGLAFMVNGNMCCGHAGLLNLNFTGRPMKGSVLVEAEGLQSDDDLTTWLNRGLAFVATLPPK